MSSILEEKDQSAVVERGVNFVGSRRGQPRGGLVKKLSSGASFRQALDSIIREGKRLSLRRSTSSTRTFKNRLKRNAHKQNFRSVFLFSSPELYYNLIAFVITCNSFYLAWWSTHIVTIVDNSDYNTVLVLFVSILPALCTFPFLANSIRSASVLKAISYLSLEIVGTVMDKSTANATSLEQFRSDFISMCSRRNVSHPRQAMIEICKQYSRDHVVLTRSEFADMLLSCGMLYASDKIRFIFSCIDINGGSTVDMGVSTNMLQYM